MEKDLYSILLTTAKKYPDKISFITPNKEITYSKLLEYCDKAAEMFWSRGIRKGDCLAIALKNSIEFIISYFGLMKIGAIAVPLNFMISKENEILHIIENCNALGIITEKEFLKNYWKLQSKLKREFFIISTDSRRENISNFWDSINHPHTNFTKSLKILADSNDIATILYTSGTTGEAKGVLLTHKNLISNAKSSIDTIKPSQNEVFLALLPMFHSLCWTTNVIIPIILGASTLIVRDITPPKLWLKAMGKEGVTIMVAVPQIYNILAREAKGLKKIFLKYWALRKLRLAISGAAPLSKHTREIFEKKFGISICEGYGLTETSPVVTINSAPQKKHGSVGTPISGVQIKIIDEKENPLPHGQAGEICVLGPNVTKGYHKNEVETAKLFTKDGWLKTGDIGIQDEEGFLFIQDRKKDMIIVKGLKVFPAQIEQIINAHPKVQESAVIGIPDKTGNEIIKCYCVPKKGIVIDKAELMKYIKEHLDSYKRPREIEILDFLPKNTFGKTLKRELLKKEIAKKIHSFCENIQ